jgi:hypothetical protein
MQTLEQSTTDFLDDYFSLQKPEIQQLLNDPDLLDRAYFFTLRHRRKPHYRKWDDCDYITSSLIDRNFKHFHTLLHSYVFGKAYRKPQKWRAKPSIHGIAAVHEPPQQTELYKAHIHLLLVRPIDLAEDDLFHQVARAWLNTPFGILGKKTVHLDGGKLIEKPLSPEDMKTHNSFFFHKEKAYSPNVVSYQIDQQSHYDSYPLGYFRI